MMHTINTFILEYLVLPTAMLAYVVFTTALIRSTVIDWLRKRREKRNQKNRPESEGR